MESKIMTMNRKNKSAFEYELPQYIPINNCDDFELTPRVSFETLKCDDLDTNRKCENDFDRSCEAESREISSCDSDSDETLSSEDEIEKPIAMMSDVELSEKIAEIYLSKMRQVATTSGKLFVSAAKVCDHFTILK